MIPGPVNDADKQGWQTQVAYAMHYVFYVAFFGLPLSGWAMWSSIAEPGPLYLAGVVPWPQLPFDQMPLTTRWRIMELAEDVHHWLVITLLLRHSAARGGGAEASFLGSARRAAGDAAGDPGRGGPPGRALA